MGLHRDVGLNFDSAERAADGDGAEQRVGSLSERYLLRALELFPHHIIVIIVVAVIMIIVIIVVIVITVICSSSE